MLWLLVGNGFSVVHNQTQKNYTSFSRLIAKKLFLTLLLKQTNTNILSVIYQLPKTRVIKSVRPSVCNRSIPTILHMDFNYICFDPRGLNRILIISQWLGKEGVMFVI